MRQLEAIDTILPYLIDDSAVKAVFLKGSLAREENDEYSDVDLYCMIEESEINYFLTKRLSYLEKYRKLIFSEEVNFVGPQIVGVYDNGLHIDLYTVTSNSLQNTDKIKVLYDPAGMLSQYRPLTFTISENDLVRYFNSISFTMLEFEAAYCRNDLIWASRLGSHLSGNIAIILRYMYDPNNAQLGFKRLFMSLDKEKHNQLIEAMNLLGPSFLPKGVQLLSELANELLNELPKEFASKVNIKFFNYMLEKIRKVVNK